MGAIAVSRPEESISQYSTKLSNSYIHSASPFGMGPQLKILTMAAYFKGHFDFIKIYFIWIALDYLAIFFLLMYRFKFYFRSNS